MYCIKCGVKLEETESACPLCGTSVCHPDFPTAGRDPLYPENKLPKSNSGTKVLGILMILLFVMVTAICFVSDLQANGQADWFGYCLGALLVSYIALALPRWFKNPNPVIFVPCSFGASALYLHYINWQTQGNWFLSFAFPLVGSLCLITCAMVTLLYYVKRGRLYVFGGGLLLLGGWLLLAEWLMTKTFPLSFVGWSVYPLVVLAVLGIFLLYLAISPSAREIMKRKLFF